MAKFDFEDFVKTVPQPVAEVLQEEGYDSLQALLCARKEDIEQLKLKRGHIGIVCRAISELQKKHQDGPFFEASKVVPRSEAADSPGLGDRLAQILGGLTVKDQPATNPPGQCLRIVDFVPSTMLAEEEVSLGGGVALKINSKPKLEKVSPGMWIAANAKILQKLMDSSDNFDVQSYLKFTEMIGELATRFTWSSVLLFDDEYRQRQAATKFKWGTDAPHLSTVTLRERPLQQTTVAGNRPNKQGGGDGRPRRVGPSGREVCLQFNRGGCTFGTRCQFDHACSTCGSKDHAGRDHPPTTPAVTPGGNKATA